MKRSAALLALLMTGLLARGAWALDSYYHTNAEIDSHLNAWQAMYPDTVQIVTIGYSQQDNLPILAAKISDHVQQDADKAKVLFVGQVHAEEVLGVEVVMTLLDTLMTSRMAPRFRAWMDTLEIWLIPTANPEGHEVVTSGLDDTYRKNKHDLIDFGHFNYWQGVGNDTDGVDVNRNFAFNWIHGDSFLQLGNFEQYDYFRGFAPMSETETQALWALGQAKKFAFSIVWHSSRRGTQSEQVFYPWNWGDARKYPPDSLVLKNTAQAVAASVPKYSGMGTYEPYDSNEPRGCQHDAFYAAFGTIPLLIECGLGDYSGMQPPETNARHIVRDNLNAAFWMLDRASGYTSATNKAQITGKVTDASGVPLPAVVTILQNDGPLLTPRTCNVFGRYRRYLTAGNYTVRASLRGYYPQQATVYASSGNAVPCNFTLQAKPMHTLGGELVSLDRETLAGTLFIMGDDVKDTIPVGANGQFARSLPEGPYRLIIDSPGRVVRFDSLNVNQDYFITYQLSLANVIFRDGFRSGLSNWTSGGTPNTWGTEMVANWPGGAVATDRPGFDYAPNTLTWLEKTAPLDLTGAQTAALRFQHWYYLEPDYDSAVVQASDDGGASWQTVCGPFDRQETGWETVYGNLNAYCGSGSVRLRWLVSSDSVLQEQGWRFDDVQIQRADTAQGVGSETSPPRRFTLIQVYPNPFNSQLAVALDLPQAQLADVTVWDVAGRQVARIHSGVLAQGAHRLSWKAPAGLAAGLYLLRIEHGQKVDIRKVLYLK